MEAQPLRGFWIRAIAVLPRDALSHGVGRLASVRWPKVLRAGLWRAFARVVGANLDEVRDPLDTFPSLQDFFTRALVEGARPIDPDEEAFVAPCDGAWGESGLVEAGRLVQVKGKTYALADLLDDPGLAPHFEGGAFATFYLSPKDYHRFHCPCDLRVASTVHVPGALWPVNRLGVEGVPGLFATNERICARMRIGRGRLAGDDDVPDLVLVAVGATLVGKIRLVFDALCTRRAGAARTENAYPGGVELAKGAEWGRFEFGSTIVMVAAPRALSLDSPPPGTPLRLGERIGRLQPPATTR